MRKEVEQYLALTFLYVLFCLAGSWMLRHNDMSMGCEIKGRN